MGAIADAIVAYAQPLMDKTDGSLEQLQKAMTLSQLCWNIAISPAETRENFITDLQSSLSMTDDDFREFRLSIIEPMIQRHREMFPLMHRPRGMDWMHGFDEMERPAVPVHSAPATKPPVADRYGPCPCGSGRKYKFCCGKR